MKKILIIVCGLICYANISFSQPLITCPATLTCNYTAGTCELPITGQWSIYGQNAQQPFTTVHLSKIYGNNKSAVSPTKQESFLQCEYDYSNNGDWWIRIVTVVTKFTGINWSFSGFGNDFGICQSVANPNTCAAE